MAGKGLGLTVDTADLKKFANRLDGISKVTKPTLAAGLNEVGDNLVTVMTNSLGKASGISLEQIRGLMRTKRASRSDLSYTITVNEDLLVPKTARKIEGKRESGDFGVDDLDPSALVIVVSKHDELVCMDCEELEAAGPMPARIAREHIPKHPHCRCILMPYVQKGKRLPVTMTSVTGTDAAARTKRDFEADMTLRQLAQSIIDRTVRDIRIELK